MLQVSGRSALSISTKLGLLFSILCVAFAIASSQISAPPEQNSRDTYKLNGTVLNAATGDPVAHAMVEITPSKPVATLTDSNGNFELDGLPESESTVNVTKPGFFNEEQISQFSHSPQQTMVRIGPDTPAITLKLVPEGIIFGQVESSDGSVENIPVKVFWATVSNGRRSWQRKETRTDDDGNFRLAELFPGTYVIAVGPSLDSNDMMMRGPATAGYFPAVFHSGSSEFSGATPVDLTAGQQVQVDFSVKKMPAYTISGKILGAEFSAGISLELRDRFGESSFFPTRFDPSTRQFFMRVPSGSYVLRANLTAPDGSMLSGQLALTVSADRSNLEITLAPSPVIPVNVRTETSSSAPQESTDRVFMIRRIENISAVSVTLQAAGDLLTPRNYWADQRQGSTTLSFRNVEPGKYAMQIAPNGPWYVQSATCGSVDLLRDDLEVTTHVDPIEIVMRSGGASIFGKAHAAAGHTIHGEILLVRDGAPHEIKTTNISDEGRFFILNLAPGGYSLLALDHLDGIEYQNPEILSKYLSKAEHIDLDSNQQLETTIELTEIEK